MKSENILKKISFWIPKISSKNHIKYIHSIYYNLKKSLNKYKYEFLINAFLRFLPKNEWIIMGLTIKVTPDLESAPQS